MRYTYTYIRATRTVQKRERMSEEEECIARKKREGTLAGS
jgi:hypothetical protein